MVPSKAEEKLIERMLSGRGPVIITQSKENVVDKYEDILRQQNVEGSRQDAESSQQEVDSSEEIALRQRLAAAERDLAKALRAHTPTTDESNVTLETETTTATTTTESTSIDSPGKGR